MLGRFNTQLNYTYQFSVLDETKQLFKAVQVILQISVLCFFSSGQPRNGKANRMGSSMSFEEVAVYVGRGLEEVGIIYRLLAIHKGF